MSQDLCVHERTIGGLQSAVDALKDGLDDIKQSQKDMVRVLEKIAVQENRIHKVEADQEETFVRLRKVELDTNTLATKIGLYAAGIGGVAAAIISALLRLIHP
jgi:hypothetical protein